jgi:hypothetical protein
MKYGKVTLGQIEAVWNKLGGNEGVQRFLSGEIVLGSFGQVVHLVSHIFTVLVDETKTIEELLASDNSNGGSGDLKLITSENFPKPINGKKLNKEIVLFRFYNSMSFKAIVAEMDKEGYKPATVWDLFGLAIKKPHLQKLFDIVALGSVHQHRGDSNVISLAGMPGEQRWIRIGKVATQYHGDNRFAAVRK